MRRKNSGPTKSPSPSTPGAIRMPSGFELVVAGGTKPVGKDAVAWARHARPGGRLILPTSMDGDGTLAGYDLEFTRAIAEAVTLPVVASGGAGKLEHFYDAVVKGGAALCWPPRSSTSGP